MKKVMSVGLVAALATSILIPFKTPLVSAEETLDAKSIVSEMTLEEKVGQMLMPDFRNWKKQGDKMAVGFTEMNDEVGSIIKNTILAA